jgi:hypothetical protein
MVLSVKELLWSAGKHAEDVNYLRMLGGSRLCALM